uniref:PRC-barrel domain-containing protein n=1 Tax=Ningiella ruwaisensis TaxID=2364274 RepID=UPI0010A0A5B3|nr:PRC-barrel domain-containing protein [Ningiella ruwaisensis]
MYTTVNHLLKFSVDATDGDIGYVKDILFDDAQFTVRYLSVDTKRWMPLSKKVLITPVGIKVFDITDKVLHVAMKKDDVLNGPEIEDHLPISREFEQVFFDYFGYGYYWNGMGLWGDFYDPTALNPMDTKANREKENEDMDDLEQIQDKEESGKPNLRSIDEIQHYDIVEKDGMKGHVHDFVLNTDTWKIEFLVIDTRNWLPGGRKVLLPSEFIQSFSWKDQAVFCDIEVQDIEQIPEYDESQINSKEYISQVKIACDNTR